MAYSLDDPQPSVPYQIARGWRQYAGDALRHAGDVGKDFVEQNIDPQLEFLKAHLAAGELAGRAAARAGSDIMAGLSGRPYEDENAQQVAALGGPSGPSDTGETTYLAAARAARAAKLAGATPTLTAGDDPATLENKFKWMGLGDNLPKAPTERPADLPGLQYSIGADAEGHPAPLHGYAPGGDTERLVAGHSDLFGDYPGSGGRGAFSQLAPTAGPDANFRDVPAGQRASWLQDRADEAMAKQAQLLGSDPFARERLGTDEALRLYKGRKASDLETQLGEEERLRQRITPYARALHGIETKINDIRSQPGFATKTPAQQEEILRELNTQRKAQLDNIQTEMQLRSILSAHPVGNLFKEPTDRGFD